MGNKTRKVLALVLCMTLCFGSLSSIGVSAETKADRNGETLPAAVEGSLLVTFEENVSARSAEKAVEKVDGDVVEQIHEEENIALVEIDEDMDAEKAIKKLERLPQVASAQPNYIYYADELGEAGSSTGEGATSENHSGNIAEYDMWHHDYVQVKEAWDLIDKIKPVSERTSKDKVIVAFLDTGISEHEDLTLNIDRENCITVIDSEQTNVSGSETGLSQAASTESEMYVRYSKPCGSHGTSLAGIIAATSYNGIGTAGVAAGNHNDLIQLMGIKVFRSDKTYTAQTNATTLDIVKGIEYACQNGAQVINMCLGHSPGAMDATGEVHNDVLLEETVNHAVAEYDVVITCSAGNQKDSRTWYPSDFDSVISVINTRKYSNAWSSDAKYQTSSYGQKKDIAAPGAGVYTTKNGGGYKTSGGTSSASASAAGVAALVRYVNPSLSVEEVRQILYSTATDLYIDGYDIYTGHGNVNAYRAVAKAAGIELPENTEKMKETSVTTKSAGTKKIEILWKEIKDANGYYIYRSTSKSGKYTKIAHITDGKTTSYTDSGRTFNKKYYYTVEVLGTSEATKAKIKSDKSAVVSGKAVTATPSLSSIKRVNSTTLKLSWPKISYANGYRIYRATSKNGTYKKVKTITKAKTTSWIDKKCTPGQTYYYKIRTYRTSNGSKVWGTMSSYKSKKAQPIQTKGLKIAKKGKKAKLSWKRDTTVKGYKIYRATSKSGPWKLVKTRKSNKTVTYTTKNLKKGKTYYYKARAYVTVNGKTVYGSYSSVKSIRR